MVNLRKTQQPIFLALDDSIAIQSTFPPRHHDEKQSNWEILPTMYETTKTIRKQSPTVYGGMKLTLLFVPTHINIIAMNVLDFKWHIKHVEKHFLPLRAWSVDVFLLFSSFRSTTEKQNDPFLLNLKRIPLWQRFRLSQNRG